MSEIVTPIVELPKGVPYTPGPNEYLITPKHSVCDVVRWLQKEGTISEVQYYINQFETPY